MANPQIGSQIFIKMTGTEPLVPAMRVQDITREQVDGHAFLEIGKRGGRSVVTTVVDTSTPNALTDVYRGLMGTLVTVILSDGKSIASVMVHSVERTGAKKCVTPVGGLNGGTWLLTCQWDLQAS